MAFLLVPVLASVVHRIETKGAVFRCEISVKDGKSVIRENVEFPDEVDEPHDEDAQDNDGEPGNPGDPDDPGGEAGDADRDTTSKKTVNVGGDTAQVQKDRKDKKGDDTKEKSAVNEQNDIEGTNDDGTRNDQDTTERSTTNKNEVRYLSDHSCEAIERVIREACDLLGCKYKCIRTKYHTVIVEFSAGDSFELNLPVQKALRALALRTEGRAEDPIKCPKCQHVMGEAEIVASTENATKDDVPELAEAEDAAKDKPSKNAKESKKKLKGDASTDMGDNVDEDGKAKSKEKIDKVKDKSNKVSKSKEKVAEKDETVDEPAEDEPQQHGTDQSDAENMGSETEKPRGKAKGGKDKGKDNKKAKSGKNKKSKPAAEPVPTDDEMSDQGESGMPDGQPSVPDAKVPSKKESKSKRNAPPESELSEDEAAPKQNKSKKAKSDAKRTQATLEVPSVGKKKPKQPTAESDQTDVDENMSQKDLSEEEPEPVVKAGKGKARGGREASKALPPATSDMKKQLPPREKSIAAEGTATQKTSRMPMPEKMPSETRVTKNRILPESRSSDDIDRPPPLRREQSTSQKGRVLERENSRPEMPMDRRMPGEQSRSGRGGGNEATDRAKAKANRIAVEQKKELTVQQEKVNELAFKTKEHTMALQLEELEFNDRLVQQKKEKLEKENARLDQQAQIEAATKAKEEKLAQRDPNKDSGRDTDQNAIGGQAGRGARADPPVVDNPDRDRISRDVPDRGRNGKNNRDDTDIRSNINRDTRETRDTRDTRDNRDAPDGYRGQSRQGPADRSRLPPDSMGGQRCPPPGPDSDLRGGGGGGGGGAGGAGGKAPRGRIQQPQSLVDNDLPQTSLRQPRNRGH